MTDDQFREMIWSQFDERSKDRELQHQKNVAEIYAKYDKLREESANQALGCYMAIFVVGALAFTAIVAFSAYSVK